MEAGFSFVRNPVSDNPMYRLFAALPVDPAIVPALRALQTGLTGASWRPERNFHITLRFFGDLSHSQARDLDDLLGEIQAPALEIWLEGIGWVNTFHLYSSHMGDGPSRYVAEADYVLEG